MSEESWAARAAAASDGKAAFEIYKGVYLAAIDGQPEDAIPAITERLLDEAEAAKSGLRATLISEIQLYNHVQSSEFMRAIRAGDDLVTFDWD